MLVFLYGWLSFILLSFTWSTLSSCPHGEMSFTDIIIISPMPGERLRKKRAHWWRSPKCRTWGSCADYSPAVRSAIHCNAAAPSFGPHYRQPEARKKCFIVDISYRAGQEYFSVMFCLLGSVTLINELKVHNVCTDIHIINRQSQLSHQLRASQFNCTIRTSVLFTYFCAWWCL